jgi:hypothetical protein
MIKYHIIKEHLKNYRINNSQSNIIKKISKENEKLLNDLLYIISVKLNSEISDFILSKNKFNKIIIEIIKNISIILHIIYDNNYFNKIPQYSRLIKITEKQLQL